LAIILTGHLYSCEDYLTTVSTDTYNEANWWQTENQAFSSLNGCYQILLNTNIGGADKLVEESFSPNCLHLTTSVIAEGIMTPGNDERFYDCWNAYYRGIGRTNNFIDNIERVQMDQSLKNRFIGEVKFLRALLYFNIVTYYGGVPLILESPDFAKHRDLPRNTQQEVIAQVLADLADAISALPMSYSGSDIGRATKGAAMALKAKVLLWENKWSEAAAAAKAVMDLNHYDLFPDYRDLFMPANENNIEVIFDVQYKDPEYYTSFDVRFEEQGANNPTLNLVQSYLMKDGKPMSESPLYDPVNPYDNRDPRLHQTIVIPGYMYRGRIVPKSHYYGTGFGQKKYTTYEDDVVTESVRRTEINYILIRYADVLLMYAEAQNESEGPDPSVYNALNKIRDRADMPQITPSLTKDQMREVIRHERRIELALEGIYYQDIRRWRIAEVVNVGPVYNIDGVAMQTRTFPVKNYLWPIHEIILQENPNLEQNPGY
ncbi:MAG: RagB/SusD family nutrient uptake outer membrane protein, partial [Syntrophomonadaceae bacterium]|nr:RagB/SusD family nutrient uptake outer membrane protein [Syntrophomonadaceae bacterium]